MAARWDRAQVVDAVLVAGWCLSLGGLVFRKPLAAAAGAAVGGGFAGWIVRGQS